MFPLRIRVFFEIVSIPKLSISMGVLDGQAGKLSSKNACLFHFDGEGMILFVHEPGSDIGSFLTLSARKTAVLRRGCGLPASVTLLAIGKGRCSGFRWRLSAAMIEHEIVTAKNCVSDGTVEQIQEGEEYHQDDDEQESLERSEHLAEI